MYRGYSPPSQEGKCVDVLGTEGICREVQKIQMQVVCKKWLCVAPWVSGVGSKTSKAWPQIRDPRELKAKWLLHGTENSLRVIPLDSSVLRTISRHGGRECDRG